MRGRRWSWYGGGRRRERSVRCRSDGEVYCVVYFFFFFKQKTAYEIYQCDWSSDVCSSDLPSARRSSMMSLIRAKGNRLSRPGSISMQPRDL